jgi:hypothetical protein
LAYARRFICAGGREKRGPKIVKLHSVASAAADTRVALSDITRQLGQQAVDGSVDAPVAGSMIFAFYGEGHDDLAVLDFLKKKFPAAAILGGTSCRGVMSEAGMAGDQSIGLLVIEDDSGDYGVASAPLGDDPAAAAEAALHAALANAQCPGELPDLIWIYQAPGHEEQVIAGLRRVVGDGCPIVGGSSADQAVAGRWRQLAGDGVLTNGIAVAALFPSGGIGYAFQGGYEPAGPSGIVTRIGFTSTGDSGVVTACQGRQLVSIDDLPASKVYDGWIGHRLGSVLETGGNILKDTAMYPLAVNAGQVDGVSRYLLIHPESIQANGALSVFADIIEGTRIYSMRGDRRRLIDRAGRVASEAISMLPAGPEALAGGLVIYCAGCMLAVDEQMPEVAAGIAQGFGPKPFLGCFTFGEQGPLVNASAHGNLMISAIAFGR